MDETRKTTKPVIRSGDRFLISLLCLIFAVGFGSAYYFLGQWQPQDTFEKILKFFCRELNLTLLFFTVLAALRCFISTTKLENALASTTLKVLIAMTLVGCALTALFVLALLGNL